VEMVVGEVAARGPRTRAGLKALLDAAGVRTVGQALIHLLFAGSLVGRIARGPLVNGEPAYVDMAGWPGPRPDPVDPAEVTSDAEGRCDLVGREPTAALPAPGLLGSFDPLLHGWVDRRPVVGEHRGVVTTSGIFRTTVLVGGRVVGTWALDRGRIGTPPGADRPRSEPSGPTTTRS
jgi:hypothetical protein